MPEINPENIGKAKGHRGQAAKPIHSTKLSSDIQHPPHELLVHP